MNRRIAYLCLQATREGQASHAHVHEIIKGLRKLGWNVELFEPSYSRSNLLPATFTRFWEFFRAQLNLWIILLKKVDLLYIRNHFAAFPTSLIAKLLGIPVIQEVNGPYEDLFIAWPWTRKFEIFFKWLIRTQLKLANRIIVVTPQLGEWVIKEAGQKQVYIIPNGANITLFNPKAASEFRLSVPYVIFFGALAPWQGINTLLQAIEQPEWPDDLFLVLMGDGVERSKVEEAAKRNKRLVYLGPLPYKKVPGVVAGSLAGLSPQNNIGGRSNTGLFPLKVFETLACGVPVIVSDFPGQADFVRGHKCGLVVQQGDPMLLTQAVAYLYNNLEKRQTMGCIGREVVEREHSWDKRSEDTDKVLKTIFEHFTDQIKGAMKYEKL